MEPNDINTNVPSVQTGNNAHPTNPEEERQRLERTLPSAKAAIKYLRQVGAKTELLAEYGDVDPRMVAKVAMSDEKARSSARDAAIYMGLLFDTNPQLMPEKAKILKGLFPTMAYKTAMLYADVGMTVYAPYLNGDTRFTDLYALNPSVLQPLVSSLKLEGGADAVFKALPKPEEMTATKLRNTAKTVKAELKPKVVGDDETASSVRTETNETPNQEQPVTLRRALMAARTEEGETQILIPGKYYEYVKGFLVSARTDQAKAKELVETLSALIK